MQTASKGLSDNATSKGLRENELVIGSAFEENRQISKDVK